jgi:hypothetical protein
MLLLGMLFFFLASLAAILFPPADVSRLLYLAPIGGFAVGCAAGLSYRARRLARTGNFRFSVAVALTGAPASDSRGWTALFWGIPVAFGTLALLLAVNGVLDHGSLETRRYIVASGTCGAIGECDFTLAESLESGTTPPFPIRRSRVKPGSDAIVPNDTVLAEVGLGFLGMPWIRQVSRAARTATAGPDVNP